MNPTITAIPFPQPLPLAEIDTPALLLDLDVLDRNLGRLASAAAARGVGLRPHFKAHRLPEICRRQIELGAHGITCAKLGEAERLAELGFNHLLVANEVVGPAKWRRLARLARRHEVIVAIDNYDVAVETAKAAQQEDAVVSFLIEVNVGLNRCGVATPEAAAELAVRCASLPGLQFRGVMGYEGHVVMLPRAQKEADCQAAMAQLVRAAERCEEAGLTVEVVSAGGTGSWDITLQQPRVTELQCGT
ncbi:MAG: alanine racemase, partial [Actinomycetota bacterium]